MAQIELIWAQDRNGAIGVNGTLPWHYSEDLKNFKKITNGNPVIMGRKTWDSLPIQPLPDRRNIVLSSKNILDAECYSSIDECLQSIDKEERVFVIGGSSIYQSFFSHAKSLHITLVDKLAKDADTYFPIGLDNIKKDFNKISEMSLCDGVIYSYWIIN